MKKLIFMTLFMIGCEGDDKLSSGNCGEYVDYMCSCHADTTDCNSLSNEYENPSTEDEEDCAGLLDQQLNDDGNDSIDQCATTNG